MKNHKGSEDYQGKTKNVIPAEFFSQIENGKKHEHCKGQDFLDCLELRRIEMPITIPVGRNLETIFKKRNEPAYDDYTP